MKTKRYVNLILLSVILGLLSSFWVFLETKAQIDAFTYFIPYRTEFLDDQFNEGSSTDDLLGDSIDTTISIAIFRDGTIIYYDHWEQRGLETDLTSPTQVSGPDRTEIWGDGDPSNGIPPNFGTDLLNAGDIITIEPPDNRVTLPRDENEIFFDGGDKLTAVGGPLAITLAVWPLPIGTLYAGAWELYATNLWGREYVIPIGEDLDDDIAPAPHRRAGFEVVGLNVQAAVDNTQVTIDLDGDGTAADPFVVTLDKGDQFTRVGKQENTSNLTNETELSKSTLVGATVETQDDDHPVQVHVLAANPDRSWEARAYTIIPRNQLATAYLAPRSSDGDYWLHNPNDDQLDVTIQSVTNTTTIEIPAGTTVKYPSAVPTITVATGIHFTADQEFYGVVALDELSRQDWGYAMQPVNRLSPQVLVAWGPGNNNNPPNGDQSRIYVTALTDTTVYLDHDNDPTSNDVEYPVSALQEVPIFAPDNDLTGAFLYTRDGTPFVAVYGQDEGANAGPPSIDVGTSILPLSSLNVQKSFQLINEADCNGVLSEGDTARFVLDYFNNGFREIPNVTIEDDLPSALSYVSNSTIQTDQNGSRAIDDSGNTPFPLDEGGLADIDVLGGRPGGTGSITFDAIVNGTAVNRAEIHWQNVLFEARSDSALVLLPAQSAPPLLLLSKTLIDPPNGPATVGQPITFSLTITNSTSDVTITKLPLQDTFNEDYLSFRSADPPETLAASGVISWTDLTTSFGQPLAPGQSVSLLVSFNVAQVPPGNDTTVRVTALNAERSNGPPLICSTDAGLAINPAPAPEPTPTPSPLPAPPSDDDDDDDDDDGPPPPAPTFTPTPTPEGEAVAALPGPPEPTPVLPVSVLPETGLKGMIPVNQIPIGIILLLTAGLGGGLIFWYARRTSKKTDLS